MKASKYAEIILNSIQENGGDFDINITAEDLIRNEKTNVVNAIKEVKKELHNIEKWLGRMCEAQDNVSGIYKLPTTIEKQKKINKLLDAMHEAQKEVDKNYLIQKNDRPKLILDNVENLFPCTCNQKIIRTYRIDVSDVDCENRPED
jgi:hypothetical protein